MVYLHRNAASGLELYNCSQTEVRLGNGKKKKTGKEKLFIWHFLNHNFLFHYKTIVYEKMSFNLTTKQGNCSYNSGSAL